MSRTTVTNSDSEFFTNINAEQLIGELCCKVGAKYHKETLRPYGARMAYEMTKEEAEDTAEKLKTLRGKEKFLLIEFAPYFERGATVNDVKESLEDFIKCFEDSQGYHCVY
jgi:hypothetical protein